MKKLSLLFLGALAMGACKKDDSSSPAATATRTDLLTAHKWRVTAQTISLTLGGVTLPGSSTIDACNQDDSYKFGADKSLVVDAGPVKCSTSDPQQETGTWAFSNTDQTKLKITLPNSAFDGEADIKELSTSTLHLYGTQTASGITYTLDATLAPY